MWGPKKRIIRKVLSSYKHEGERLLAQESQGGSPEKEGEFNIKI